MISKTQTARIASADQAKAIALAAQKIQEKQKADFWEKYPYFLYKIEKDILLKIEKAAKKGHDSLIYNYDHILDYVVGNNVIIFNIFNSELIWNSNTKEIICGEIRKLGFVAFDANNGSGVMIDWKGKAPNFINSLAEKYKKITNEAATRKEEALAKQAEKDIDKILKDALRKINKIAQKGKRSIDYHYNSIFHNAWNNVSRKLLAEKLTEMGFKVRKYNSHSSYFDSNIEHLEIWW